jgi:tyrosyl-tRNA synthetase
MSLGDDSIIPIFKLLTDVSNEEINSFDVSKNPMELKKRSACLVIEQLYNKDEAKKALENFENVFASGGIPNDILEFSGVGKKLIEVLIEAGLVSSKTEFKRLVSGGAIEFLDKNKTVSDFEETALSGVYKIGKKRFVKVV